MNQNVISGKWLEIKGEVQKAWGKLTSDELEQTKGDMKSISGLIQQKYGSVESDYNEKLSGIYKKFEAKKDAAVESIKESLKQ